ncbi:acyl-CoA dehydrogenase family protein [Intrasporangium calvum]|uniref:Acyl-CoA dehydrogenase domain-containing protein n=1 Tax=Intrasporangium calvum (strain ATCC 23552 / DSM 43043 / JCM 3097 / NBRC 12989 / NCIMB 10167 / NRRL B-3866 / 7 KIP) TaxID=710696 RepID=E6SFW3_INTC7|nr:acyl-CoA dehydrogenase family protein [Intrasporangium calvum]ADU48892.1 acyl-CoA dehydrogenase domain-containing protein [Intrasporangium calvum DSM 43043]
MINLEVPRKLIPLLHQTRGFAEEVMRPISRKYDRAEHSYPIELDLVSAVIDGLTDSGTGQGAGAAGATRSQDVPVEIAEIAGVAGVGAGRREPRANGNRNGTNLSSVLSVMETCRGDVGLALSIPRQGLGNAAIAAVANAEQKARYGRRWAAMAITEPDAGSDSGAIRTTAVKDGDDYVLNGEKIFVTAGERAELVVVWATLDRSLGKKAIKSFVVERSNPGFTLVRLEHKLGIRASDTASFHLDNCRVPARDLLGDPEISTETGFGGAMATFDNTRPLVAAMAVGLTRACLDTTTELLARAGVTVDWDRPPLSQSAAAARLAELEAEYQAAYLLMMRAAWMADNGRPNSMEASMAKAKAGRTCVDVALACVELGGPTGYAETELLEKWARDAKILDIFEGTQQIQLLVVARRLLGLTSAELK